MTSETLGKRYRCDFCGKTFQREVWYKKHVCEKQKRFNESHNMDVLFGLKLFNHWLRRNGFIRRNKERTIKEFCKSPMYPAFVDLVAFSRRTYLISVFRYLNWLIDNRIGEDDWQKEKMVESYRISVRGQDNAENQTRTTFENAKAWCAKHEFGLADFFVRITPGDALNWIMLNKLSPWVLFGYDRAVIDLLARFDEEKLHILDEYINTEYWLSRIRHDDGEVIIVQDLCERLFDVG